MSDETNPPANLPYLIMQNIMVIGQEAECLLNDYKLLLDESQDDDTRCKGLFDSCKHLENLASNVSVTYKAVLDHIAPVELLIELTRERLEVQNGKPVVVDEVELGDGMVAYGFREEEIVVPDDLTGIDGEEE